MESAQHRTLTWRVYQDIVQMVSFGRLPAGSRIDEQLIAEELGVSRTPVREAIARLTKDGLVENRPYRGNFVRTFTVKEVHDLYEVRKSLESLAVQLAIPNFNEDSVGELRGILVEIDTVLAAGDLEAYGLADQQFHAVIAQLSRNKTLIALLQQLSGQIQLIRAMANRDPDVVEITAMERPEIVDAMAARDVGRAVQLMEEHISLVQRYTTSLFQQGSTHSRDLAD